MCARLARQRRQNMTRPEIARVEIKSRGHGSFLAAFVDGKYLGTVHADDSGIVIHPCPLSLREAKEAAAMTDGDGS